MADLRFNVSAETRQATAALGSFAQSVQKNLVQAVRALPNIEINADSSDAEREMKRIRDAMADLANKKVGIDISAEDASREVERLQSELQTLGGTTTDVGVQANTAAASKALDAIIAQTRQVDGTDAEVEVTADTSAAQEEVSRFGDAAKVTAAAAGAGIGLALSQGISTALDIQSGTQQLQAQFGLTEEAAVRAGTAAGEVFRSGLTGDMGVARQAVAAVGTELVDLGTASVDDVNRLSQSALLLATTFDQDVGETARAAGQLIRNGLARDAEHAFDILTRGFQEGGNASGDFLETINEYSPFLSQLGISGEQAFGMLAAAQKAGIRDSDAFADALKEFSLRAVDTADAVTGAYQDIGLDADKTRAAIAGGGPAAATAMSQVVQALLSVKDPVEQNRIGVELFGTQWEDTARHILPVFDPLKSGLTDVGGATDRVNDATTTSQQKVQALRNEFDLWAASMISTEGPVGDIAAGISAFGPAALAAAGALGPLLLALRMNGVAGAIRGGPVASIDEIGAASERTEKKSGKLGGVLKGLGVGLGLGAIAIGLDEINVAAAGGAEKLGYMEENLHTLVQAGGMLASGDFTGIGDQIASEWEMVVRSFETGTSDAGRMWADFQREMSGFELTDLNIDITANPDGARDVINGLLDEVNSAGAEVNINGNANPAGFALRTILGEIAAGAETVMIDGESMPAQEALEYVKALISNSAGEVTINGETLPAGEALARFVALTDTTPALVHLDGDIDPVTGKLQTAVAMADGSTGVVTLDGDPQLVNGKTVQSVQFADGSRGTITLDGNPNPFSGAVSGSVQWANGQRSTVTAYANTAPLNSAVSGAIAHWNNRQIYVNIGGGRVTAGGGLLGYAGGGMVPGQRVSRTSGMVIPGYAPGVDDVPLIASRGEAVLVPELVRRIGGRRILAANAEASGGRPATIAGAVASMMDGTVDRTGMNGGGMVGASHSYYSSIATMAGGGMVEQPLAGTVARSAVSAAVGTARGITASHGDAIVAGLAGVRSELRTEVRALRSDIARGNYGQAQLAALQSLAGALKATQRGASADAQAGLSKSVTGAW